MTPTGPIYIIHSSTTEVTVCRDRTNIPGGYDYLGEAPEDVADQSAPIDDHSDEPPASELPDPKGEEDHAGELGSGNAGDGRGPDGSGEPDAGPGNADGTPERADGVQRKKGARKA